MIIAINYSNELYKKQQMKNSLSAQKKGKVDKIISYTQDDIENEFYLINNDIFQHPRGAGLWLWKPYIINKTLTAISVGDYLIYTDSGSIYLRKIDPLIVKLEESNQDIMLFETPLIECQWTKKEVLIQLNAYNDSIRFSPQIMGTFILVKKTNKSISFIKRWLEYCSNKDMLLPKMKDETEDEFYIAHREDQSILSVLAKKEGIIPFKDPSDYGKFPNQFLEYDRFFFVGKKDNIFNIEIPFFLSYRNANFTKYRLAYFIKCILNKLKLKRITFS